MKQLFDDIKLAVSLIFRFFFPVLKYFLLATLLFAGCYIGFLLSINIINALLAMLVWFFVFIIGVVTVFIRAYRNAERPGAK